MPLSIWFRIGTGGSVVVVVVGVVSTTVVTGGVVAGGEIAVALFEGAVFLLLFGEFADFIFRPREFVAGGGEFGGGLLVLLAEVLVGLGEVVVFVP